MQAKQRPSSCTPHRIKANTMATSPDSWIVLEMTEKQSGCRLHGLLERVKHRLRRKNRTHLLRLFAFAVTVDDIELL